jgi:hypothetical protein
MNERRVQIGLMLCGVSIAAYAGCGGGGTGGTTTGDTTTTATVTSASVTSSSSGSTSATTTTSVAAVSSGGDDMLLGAQCSDDTMCGMALKCIKDSDTDKTFGGGPAGGYCTKTCTTDTDCPGNGSACLTPAKGADGVCVLTCDIGPALMYLNDALDPNKCLGRDDLRCFPLSNATSGCMPTCGGDAQCPAGRVCDPRTAVCVDTPNMGKPEGSKCNQMAAMPECAGVCVSFGGSITQCTSPCVLGGDPSDPSNTPNCGGIEKGLCAYSPQGNGAGDYGFCAPSCGKQDECENPDFWCFSVGGLTGMSTMKGYCFGSTPCPNGDSDCAKNPMNKCTMTKYGPLCLDPTFDLGSAGSGTSSSSSSGTSTGTGTGTSTSTGTGAGGAGGASSSVSASVSSVASSGTGLGGAGGAMAASSSTGP